MSRNASGSANRGSRVAGEGAVAACALFLAASGAAAADCANLAGETFGPATIDAATNVAPPSSILGTETPTPTPVALNAPFCRVQGSIKPSPDSDIAFEVWLPPQSAWNGKYQGVGNGGFAGSILYGSMNRALEGGYAVSGTNTGHAGGALDAAWAFGHPEKITDFGWRGIQVSIPRQSRGL